MATPGGGPFFYRNSFAGVCSWQSVWRFSSFEPNQFQGGAFIGVVPWRALELRLGQTGVLKRFQ